MRMRWEDDPEKKTKKQKNKKTKIEEKKNNNINEITLKDKINCRIGYNYAT